MNVDSLAYYTGFGKRVTTIRSALRNLVAELKHRGKTIAGYGAAAKGTTLLNYCDLGRESIEFVVDRNSYKQGRFTPGTHLPILPVEALLEKQPDYTLLLAWNFAEEILHQQQAYRGRGGRFIVPIPEVTVIEPKG